MYNLFVVALLMGCGGCQKTTDPVVGPAVSDSVRVARQTIKELISPSQPSRLEEETVVVEGQSYRVGTVQQSSYSYDKQGRILTEYNQYFGASSMTERTDSIYYEYVGSAVNIRRVALNTVPKRVTTQRLALDSRGFAEKQPTIFVATYDAKGYLLALRDEYGRTVARIENGNVLELSVSTSPSTPTYIFRNTYDLTKAGLPSIQPIYGKPSRNLVIETAIDRDNFYSIDKNVYKTTYWYKYDQYNRIVRQIARSIEGVALYEFGDNTIRATDFSYVSSPR
ncbi:hypothetical protein AWR27_15585 [Spirosoma montaniterrae]|uniref:DUF4595 domain-containing protein n=1 Tax=Spirosoma montaniterrae TaxID=1178516 RepID=A0A1P9WZ15_9BACT|nr:hypothetical protein AWR27_15585 [Spirosoma montaniterrae]